jgi:hypothetical protein
MRLFRTSGVMMLSAIGAGQAVRSLLAGVDESNTGWVRTAVFVDDDSFTLRTAGSHTVALSHDLVASYLGSTVVLLAAISLMRGSTPAPSRVAIASVEIDAPSRGTPGLVRCSWPIDTQGVVVTHEGDQMNFYLREDLAADLLTKLAASLGAIVAGLPDPERSRTA